MINNGYRSVAKFLLIIVCFQILVICYIAKPPESKRYYVPPIDYYLFERATGGYELKSSPNDPKILPLPEDIVAAKSNLPFKETYKNANKSFTQSIPPSLESWMPSPDSYKYFQPIGDVDAWFYSAFFDHQKLAVGSPMVRAFGLARKPFPSGIICFFCSRRCKQVIQKPGKIIALPEDHATKVVPVSYECPIPKNYYPQVISIATVDQTSLSNRMYVSYSGHRKRNFTVCYSALHSVYNKTSELIQSIELNTLLGAEHFYVYNFSISQETDTILRFYQSKGVMTILQWPIPTLESWYLGQMASINDCLYRNRNASQYVVLVDTDEYILSRKNQTWMELIEELLNDAGLSTLSPIRSFGGSTSFSHGRRLLSIDENDEKVPKVPDPVPAQSIDPGSKKMAAVANKIITRSKDNETKKSDSVHNMEVVKSSMVQAKAAMAVLDVNDTAMKNGANATKVNNVSSSIKASSSLTLSPSSSSSELSAKSAASNTSSSATAIVAPPSKLTLKQKPEAAAPVPPKSSASAAAPVPPKSSASAAASPSNTTKNITVLVKEVNKTETLLANNITNSSLQEPLAVQELIGAFQFRCAFFDSTRTSRWTEVKETFNISDTEDEFIHQFLVQPILANIRTNFIFPHRIRTKNIVRPELINTMGIHFVYYHNFQAKTLYINSNSALLHHYRSHDPRRSQTLDTAAFRYKKALFERLKDKYVLFPKLFPQS